MESKRRENDKKLAIFFPYLLRLRTTDVRNDLLLPFSMSLSQLWRFIERVTHIPHAAISDPSTTFRRSHGSAHIFWRDWMIVCWQLHSVDCIFFLHLDLRLALSPGVSWLNFAIPVGFLSETVTKGLEFSHPICPWLAGPYIWWKACNRSQPFLWIRNLHEWEV